MSHKDRPRQHKKEERLKLSSAGRNGWNQTQTIILIIVRYESNAMLRSIQGGCADS